MNLKMILAAMAAALSVAAPAWADAAHSTNQGHYEWRSVPQYGPRATGPVQRRVWVADHAQMANCNCEMMKMSADDCMGAMHRGRDKPSAG
jgi:hypothetical protein